MVQTHQKIKGIIYSLKTSGRVHRPKSYPVLDKSHLNFMIFAGNFFCKKRVHYEIGNETGIESFQKNDKRQ